MSKPRKVYSRQSIVHICYRGCLWSAEGDTLVQPGGTVKVDKEIFEDGDDEFSAIQVYQAGETGPIRETWYITEIVSQRKPKAKPTTEASVTAEEAPSLTLVTEAA